MTNVLHTIAARCLMAPSIATAGTPARPPRRLAVPLGSAAALTLGGSTSGSENKRKIYA